MKKIEIIRAYEHSKIKNKKGYKVLVDKLWPRGIKKEDLPFEWWLKELAPSGDLRKWFNHEDDKFDTFKEKYLKEIKENKLSASVATFLKEILKKENVILIYGAKNEKHNQAVILKEWLENN